MFKNLIKEKRKFKPFNFVQKLLVANDERLEERIQMDIQILTPITLSIKIWKFPCNVNHLKNITVLRICNSGYSIFFRVDTSKQRKSYTALNYRTGSIRTTGDFTLSNTKIIIKKRSQPRRKTIQTSRITICPNPG